MPGKILGIDISEHRISAVQVISGLKGYDVVSCSSTPVSDNNIEKALEELSDGFDLKSDKCILTVPSSNASFRNISTPFKDSKKIRQTLPFEIETLVPFAIDEKILDYIHTDEDNPESIFTAAMDKDFIGDYIEQLKTTGVDPDIIDIRPVPAVSWLLGQETTPENGIYLDLEPEQPCVVIFQNKKIALIRELPCSFTKKTEGTTPEETKASISEPIENIINTICREADRTVYSFYSGLKNNFSIEKVFFGGRLSAHSITSDILSNFFKTAADRITISKDSNLKMDAGLSGIYKPALMDNALAATMRESKKSIGFNFRRDEFAVKRKFLGPGKDIRRVAILICTFFVLLLLNTCVDYYYIKKQYTMVEEQFNKEFENRFPEKRGIKDLGLRILQVQQKIKEFKNPSSQVSGGVRTDIKVLDILYEISQRVDDKYDFDVNKLTIKNNEIKIIATTDDYPTVNRIVNSLKESALLKIKDQGKSLPAKDRIKFDLTLVIAEQ